MGKRETIDEFRSAVEAEERLVSTELAADSFGVLIKAAINEFDWYFYNLQGSAAQTDEQAYQFYLLQLGINRLIKLALESRPSYDVPVVMFTRDKKLSLKVFELIGHLVFVEHGRRVADTVATGVGDILKTGTSQFEFIIPQKIIDASYYERTLTEHYDRESERLFREAVEAEATSNDIRKLVAELLAENVRVFQQHYIAYDADPTLDDYFFWHASRKIELQQGFDTFNGRIEFGGIRYQKYVVAAIFFLSLALKHQAFCEALVRKQPSIRLFNILTIPCERSAFLASLKGALNSYGMNFDAFTHTTDKES